MPNSKIIWNYENGGDNWTGLCKTGSKQSPINLPIEGVEKTKLPLKINFNNVIRGASVFNSGDFIEFGSTGSLGNFKFNGKQYNILQLHFHTISSHSINNKKYIMEMHIVGEARDKTLGVIGVFFEIGAFSVFLKNIGWNKSIASLPFPNCKNSEGKIVKCDALNIKRPFVPIKKSIPQIRLGDLNKVLTGKPFYTYEGSLTTPDCDEIVTWIVFKNPMTLSKEQMSYYNDLIINSIPTTWMNNFRNNRRIQPRNGRRILLSV